MPTTYSFKDLTGGFVHPIAGSYILNGGHIGLGQITISMTQDRTVQDVSSDGSVMVSYIAGDNGTIAIEVQQTSSLHEFLLSWFNACKTAADSGDVTNWASASISIRNLLDGSTHTATGVSPGKVPDKVYQKQGQNITWTLPAARIVSE
jgi:Protein of unknown function (DUF3277)